MAVDRPSLAELSRSAEAELPLATGSDPLRRNVFTPLARALAGAVHGLYGNQDWMARQLFPQTCDEDFLENVHVPIWLPGGRKPATAATGNITVTGTAGAALAQGEVFSRADGLTYLVVTGVTIPANASSVTASVVCETPGEAGNTEPGGKLQLVNTVSGIAGEAVVLTPGLSGGADIESVEDLRARVVEARSKGGEVGRDIDWAAWAKEVAGVTRAWAAPQFNGLGTVAVYFVRDDDASIYPDAAERAAVLAHLEATGTPFGEILALSPAQRVQNFTIHLSPDTPEIRSAVQSALAAVIASESSPVKMDSSGRTVMPLSGVTIPRSHLTAAISNAAGEFDHSMTVPSADIVCALGEMLEIGTITWS